MCYDVNAQLETQLKRAMRDADEHAIREIREKMARETDLPLFHVTGFQHPRMFIYTNESPNFTVVSQWGLVPFWAKDKNDIWNKTLIARGETIFDKNSFRSSAKGKRCLIYIDGFYEHHHHGKETVPYYISREDLRPMGPGRTLERMDGPGNRGNPQYPFHRDHRRPSHDGRDP